MSITPLHFRTRKGNVSVILKLPCSTCLLPALVPKGTRLTGLAGLAGLFGEVARLSENPRRHSTACLWWAIGTAKRVFLSCVAIVFRVLSCTSSRVDLDVPRR